MALNFTVTLCGLFETLTLTGFDNLFEDKVICGFYPSLLCLSVCLRQTLLNYIIGEKIYFQKNTRAAFCPDQMMAGDSRWSQ